MKLSLYLFFLFLSIQFVAHAQTNLNGQIFDQSSRKALDRVEVINISNSERTQTNSKGEFVIKAKTGDVMVYFLLGYTPDTVLLVDIKPLTHFLSTAYNTLNTVKIAGKVNNKEVYADVYNKANPILLTPGRGLRFYPSTFFGKEGRNARRLKRIIENNEVEKVIDKRFNSTTVTQVLSLKQPQLDAFLVLFRPDIRFAFNADATDFKVYLLEAYEKFKLLPADQKILPKLKR